MQLCVCIECAMYIHYNKICYSPKFDFLKGAMMSKEVQMTFRVESGLRTDFAAAAAAEDRPAAQLLREFMRTYVNQSKQKLLTTANDNVSPAEKRRREQAVNFARASVGLEGFKPSPAAEASARQFINGRVNMAELAKPIKDAE